MDSTSYDENKEEKLSEEELLLQKAEVRAAEYRYIMENADTDEEKKDALASIKKDSCPNIRAMYEEYLEKNPELVRNTEQEKSQQSNHPEKKHGLKKIFDR